MRPELCDVCRSIKLRPPTIQSDRVWPYDFFLDEAKGSPAQFHHHHSSFQRLQESANSGCPFCVLLVQSFENTEDSFCTNPRVWDGIIVAWYKASIESEYKFSIKRKLGIDISHITGKYPNEWDKLHVYSHLGVCSCPGQVLNTYTFPGRSKFLSGLICNPTCTNEYRQSSGAMYFRSASS